MTKKSTPRSVGSVPPARAPRQPPTGTHVRLPRDNSPLMQVPSSSQQSTRTPPQRPIGKVPNPRKPKLVRDHRGGALKDLFEIFPDLPRPRRPVARVQPRRHTGKAGPPRRPR